jgi:hypothetical protein
MAYLVEYLVVLCRVHELANEPQQIDLQPRRGQIMIVVLLGRRKLAVQDLCVREEGGKLIANTK